MIVSWPAPARLQAIGIGGRVFLGLGQVGPGQSESEGDDFVMVSAGELSRRNRRGGEAGDHPSIQRQACSGYSKCNLFVKTGEGEFPSYSFKRTVAEENPLPSLTRIRFPVILLKDCQRMGPPAGFPIRLWKIL